MFPKDRCEPAKVGWEIKKKKEKQTKILTGDVRHQN